MTDSAGVCGVLRYAGHQVKGQIHPWGQTGKRYDRRSTGEHQKGGPEPRVGGQEAFWVKDAEGEAEGMLK